jgi:N-formylglutamate deformylase
MMDPMMNNTIYTLHRGSSPLLVSLPHTGTLIPTEIAQRMVPRALAVEDTDWLLHEVYAFARDLGASLLIPRHSRYVIDLNRPPNNQPMYAGSNNTELCPTRFFTGDPLYLDGQAPDAQAVQARRAQYWQPYHDALQGELARLKAQHGHAVLFDGHSIKSRLPWLFEGELPALNLGTVDGSSCAPELREQLAKLLAARQDFSHVVDARFKGGNITRHYGKPADNIHAVQLEMCWRCYMDEDSAPQLDPARLSRIQPLLERLLIVLRDWRPATVGAGT